MHQGQNQVLRAAVSVHFLPFFCHFAVNNIEGALWHGLYLAQGVLFVILKIILLAYGEKWDKS